MHPISLHSFSTFLWVVRCIGFIFMMYCLGYLLKIPMIHDINLFIQLFYNIAIIFFLIIGIGLWGIYEYEHYLTQKITRTLNTLIQRKRKSFQKNAPLKWQTHLGSIWHHHLHTAKHYGENSALAVVEHFTVMYKHLSITTRHLKTLDIHLKEHHAQLPDDVQQELEDVLMDMEQRTANLREHANQAITELQSQDRISQILQHVMDSLEKVNEHLQTTHRWLNNAEIEKIGFALKASYAMQEERAAHHTNEMSQEDNETLFF
jgi:hypothetical protein